MIKKVHKILKLKFEKFSHNQVQGKVDYYQKILNIFSFKCMSMIKIIILYRYPILGNIYNYYFTKS